MADWPPSSSQGSLYEQHQIPKKNWQDHDDIASSPLRSSPLSKPTRPRKPPNITPQRFRRFFTPRNSFSARNGRSKATDRLRDITKNAVNRKSDDGRAIGKDGLTSMLVETQHDTSNRPPKRRRWELEIPSSPPLSSPIKDIHPRDEILIFEDHVAPPITPHDEEAWSNELGLPDHFPTPVLRLRQGKGSTQRLLQRSFGGYDGITRGYRGNDHGAQWLPSTANFATTPSDLHQAIGGAVPFCTAGCGTNSLVAVGFETGEVKLLDTAADTDFTKPYVSFRPHKNAIIDMAFSSDDYLLATASGDQTARLVDMRTQQTRTVLAGHTTSLKQIRFQPGNDNIMTSSGRDGSVQIWDLRCSSKCSASELPTSWARYVDGDGVHSIPALFSYQRLTVGAAHKPSLLLTAPERPAEWEAALSITAIQHLPAGRSHMLLTASEEDASIKLWDLRQAGRAKRPEPVSSTTVPPSHTNRRNFGISSLCLSTDGARLFAVCKDSHVYAYSANHLALGSVPEMRLCGDGDWTTRSVASRHLGPGKPQQGLQPLYAFRHSAFRNGSFYVRAAVRPARQDRGEMLAVGSSNHAPILFPIDERYLACRPGHSSRATGRLGGRDAANHGDGMSLPRSGPLQPATPEVDFPIYTEGTALVRGHVHEVTGVAWSHDGDLVTIGDDRRVRCWRENDVKARQLRSCGDSGEGAHTRWNCGWADVDDRWDEEEG